MEPTNNQEEYSTKDLHFAAFLQVKGLVVQRLEQRGRANRGQNPCFFVFNEKERCIELEDIFWNGVGDEIMVNAKDYFTTIRDLRARIFSVNRPRQRYRGNTPLVNDVRLKSPLDY